MDPFVAFLMCLTACGGFSGPLFCGLKKVNAGISFKYSTQLSAKKFQEFFSNRLIEIVIGQGEVFMYTGNSIERGSVQRFR